MMDTNSAIARNPRVTSQGLAPGAGCVLLHLDSTDYHSLNHHGALIWELIHHDTTFGSLLDALSERISDAPPDFEDDIASFLHDLEHRDLIRVDRLKPADRPNGD